MTDLEVRQRLQTSTFGEGIQLLTWINSHEVADRLADPVIAKVPGGTCVLQSPQWVIYRGTSINVSAMSASIFVAERNDLDTILSISVKLPSYKQSAVVLRLPVSNDILRMCPLSTRKTFAQHLVTAMTMGLSSNGMISIRGPIPANNNPAHYRRDAWLEESIHGQIRKRDLLFSYA